MIGKLKNILAALEANDMWHRNRDDHGDYPGSELGVKNLEAIRQAKESILAAEADACDLDDLLVVAFLSPRKENEPMRDAVRRLIEWEVSIALDPAVSSAAQALIDRGRQG